MDDSSSGEASATTARSRGGALLCFGVAFAPVLVSYFIVQFGLPGIHYIGGKPDGVPYVSTRFEFRFGHKMRIVDDPGNHMQWVYGEMPRLITVADGIRLIIYDEPGAIIKSSQDSMEVDEHFLRHKGYMGVWSNETRFLVDTAGMVQLP
ncbi:MAG: hypothetical protein K8U03_22510 [Planctomycetia bacterium]|nr:hypothetical protein [Planctomycetia bacterium]